MASNCHFLQFFLAVNGLVEVTPPNNRGVLLMEISLNGGVLSMEVAPLNGGVPLMEVSS